MRLASYYTPSTEDSSVLRMSTNFRYTPEVLPEMSRESGVSIVVGTAYYVDSFIPEEVKNMTVQQVYLKAKFVIIIVHSSFFLNLDIRHSSE